MKDKYVMNLIIILVQRYLIKLIKLMCKNNKNSASLSFKPIDEEEIKSIVINCKSKSSLDSDNVCMYLIQQTIHYIVKPLTYIFNLSFKICIFQSKMKQAKIIPIFKKEKRLRSYLIIVHIIITTIVKNFGKNIF